MRHSLHSSPTRHGTQTIRARSAVAVIAFLALLLTGLTAVQAHAAPAPSGQYSGSSTAYNGATVAFSVDDNGVMSGFTTTSYCTGSFLTPITWSGMPLTTIEAGVPFDLRWEEPQGSQYHELTGTVNADGTASGTGRAGQLPFGACGGNQFTWTASVPGGVDPVPDLDPEATVTPGSLTVSELAADGVTVNGTGFAADSDVTLQIDGAAAGTSVADADGAVSLSYTAPAAAPGTYTARLVSGDAAAEATFTVTADPVVLDPAATVTPQTLTVSELAATGVTVDGTGFAADSTVALQVDGAEVQTATANGDGAVSFTYTAANAATRGYTATLVSGSASAETTFTVTADPVVVPPLDPAATVTPGTLTVSELAATGVTVNGTGFAAGSDVTLQIDGAGAGTSTADADGAVSVTYTAPAAAPGSYTATLVSGSASAETTFTVTADPVVDPPLDPAASVTPGSLTVSALAATGVAVNGTGFAADADVTLQIDGTDVQTIASDSDGAVTFTYTVANAATGSHTATLVSGSTSAEATFTVTADPVVDPPLTPAATVTPGSLTVSALAADGVTITGTGFTADSDVTLQIDGTDVQTIAADDEGTVAFTYTATDAVTGSYAVTLVSGDATASATFVVTADPVVDPPVVEPAATATPATLTVSELAATGVTVDGSGFAAGSDVTLRIDGTDVQTVTADDEGTVSLTYTAADAAVGDYTAALVSGGTVAEVTFTVIADPVVEPPVVDPPVVDPPVIDPALPIPAITPTVDSLDPALEGAIQAPAITTPGAAITIAVDGAQPGDRVGVWMFSTPVYLGAHVVSEAGTISVVIPADAAPGVHRLAVYAESGVLLGWTAITVAAPADVVTVPVVGAAPGTTVTVGGQTLASTGGSTSASLAAGALLLLGASLLVARRRLSALR